MDEDLKIVLTSELEADEQASARRISAQLPNIAKLINSKSNIKVGVTLDESTIQAQTQKLTQQIARVAKTQGIGVSLSLDQSSVNKIQTELNNLKVNPDISRAMTDQLDQMGIQIDKISGRWEAVNGQQERMLNLTIQGTDQMGRTVTYLQTYDTETGNINTHLTNVTANLEKQRNAQEQLAKQAKADNESRVSYLTKQQALLADIQATYAGATSAKPVTNDSHLAELNNTYSAINAQIQSMIANEGKLDSVQRSNLEAQISGLKRMVKEYQNAEYVATKLRTKDIGAIKSDQLSGLEALEKRLEAAGTLTDTFRQKIDGLKTSLNGVSNKDQLVSFLNSFDQLNNDVSVFQERLRGVNNIYTQLIALDKQITSVQSAMTKLDPKADENKLVALRGQLAVLNNQKASLEAQLAPYSDIVQYAKQATVLEQSRLMNGSQLVYNQMELADKARQYDEIMQRIPRTIADLQTKYNQLVSPTETVTRNMNQLRELAAQYSSDMSDREKVQTYERLQQLIGACSKEMSELMRVQRGEVNDFKFIQNLEKAKADLATVGRTWSALKQDPGLNAQFLQLTQNLKTVNNQMDLNKWTAQFSAFKSEVKAAGKNMQSLGDILKNNVSKVLQWVSATTLLFRAFRLLRTALSTIVDLDTAMIDLQKVTVATRAEYDRFYRSANDTAKALGVTTEEVISQTAEWARLGYAMQDAAKLAENSAIFKAISPGMDITIATDGLVSMLKAFDEIDVNDSLDGIISKVNDVGNKFAVSNKDIVEAMTRMSSAMKAANNTFEETVALATAAIEITRDAASVGNGLKTLSMRIRGYDEETEEYSNDVAVLTGAIADLTKVTSNGNRGISIFEPGDPETYRSTYDILADIADIWVEMTDKNRASLLEVLFGKRQAQIGSAILSNFDQARKAIEVMEDSAGSANREMEKIEQSLEYKLNALQETWVGVAQNLFQTDDMKLVVDGLMGISNVIDSLTNKLGLFGTAGVAVSVAALLRLKSTIGAVVPVLQTLSNIPFDGGTASVFRYVSALNSLDPVQRKFTMNTLGMTSGQQDQIIKMMMATAVLKQYTVAELEHIAGLEAGQIAEALKISSTAMVTEETLKAALASGVLNEAQLAAIMSTNAQTAANTVSAGSFFALATSAKAAALAMLTNPLTWIAAAPLLIGLVVKAFDALIFTAEEATEKMEESFSEFEEASNKMGNLNDELQTTKDRISELESQGNLTFVEESELQKLRDAVELLQIQADLAEKERSREAREAADDTITAYRKNFKNSITSDAVQDYVASSNTTGNNAILFSDESNISAMLAGVEQMKHLRSEVDEGSEDYVHFQEVIDDATDSIWEQADVLGTYKRNLEAIPYSELTDDQKAALDEINAAIELIYKTLDPSKWKDIQWNSIINDSQYADDARKLEELASKSKVTADTIKSQFPSLAQACEDAGLKIEDVVDNLNASFGRANGENVSAYSNNLSNLADVISELRTSYDLLEGAQSEMDENGGLSAETVEKLAKAEENYLDYLYEENGAVKLNTEAWKENANAKIKSDMRGIQNEIASIEARNAALLESIQLYEDQMALGDPGGEYAEKIEEATREIEKNSEAVLENQKKYGIYASVFQQVSDDGNAAFETLTDKLTEITELYDLVEKAQDEFSQSGVLSASTLSSIAGKFPEMQNFIDLYIAGLKTGKELLEELSTAYGTDLANWRNAISKKMACSVEFYNSLTSDQKKLIDELGEAYGVDLKNFKTIEQKKVAFQAEIIKALASNYGKYTNASLEGMKAQYDAMMNMGGDAEEIKALGDSIMAIENYNAAINRIAIGDGLTSSWDPQRFSNSLDKSDNPGADSKDIEEYIAEIDKYRDAKERLLQTEEKTAKLQRELEHTYRLGSDDNEAQRGQIQLHQELITAYEEEKNALHDLNEMRDKTISEGADSLRQLGFDVEYDSDANLFYVKNLEHLNELTADSQGEYESMQEATNALRKDTEGLIDTLSELNEANQEGSESWWESYYAQIEEELAIYESVLQELENKSNLKKHHIDLAVEAGNVDGIRQYTEEYISLNREMQQKVHEEADYYRSLGEDENGEHISKLSEQWYGYRDNIVGAVSSAYDAVKSLTENSITLTENWLDNAVEGKDFSGVQKNAAALVSYYQSLQEEAHRQAEELRNSGLSDISDDVSKLSDDWWEYEESIKSVKQRVVDYLIEIVDASHKAVDEIQNVISTLQEAADEFAANDGFITVDTYQALLQLGPQYMQMLKDENGLWQINEERINDVIAARTRQLAVENAMSYVERLKLAAQEGSIEDLNHLCFATTDATNSTWGLVYAELELMHTMGDLNDSQYQAALHNIEAMQDLADNVVANIGKATDSVAKNLEATRKQLEDTKKGLQDLLDELEDMEGGANDLVKYVMDMLKHRIQEQIDLLEEMKDKYSEIIALKKESLDAAKNEQDYQKSIAKKLKEMAKLQERINALSLDDSRSAQAERAKLLEEMAELQEDLADSQTDKSIEAQKEALGQMEEDYHAEKDKEIEILEDSISSYQKLYDMAIDYIRNNWNTLYQELIEWNTEYGSVLNSEITAAWDAAQDAAQRYGDFVSAIMGGISDEIDGITKQIEALDEQMSSLSTSSDSSDTGEAGTENRNTTVGNKTTHTSPSNEDMVRTIVNRMKEYGAAWSTKNDKAANDALHQKAANLARQLDQYGVHADFRDSDGTWWITRDELHPNNVGKMLHNCYHTGGFVGDEPLKPNEQYIKAENGELMMTSSQQDSLVAQLDRISAMADVLADGVAFGPTPAVGGRLSQAERGTINNITNNSRPIEINVGDTIIQGNASAETVSAHGKMTEKMINELARMVGVKW